MIKSTIKKELMHLRGWCLNITGVLYIVCFKGVFLK